MVNNNNIASVNSESEAMKELIKIRKLYEDLKASTAKKLALKVSEKGAVSIYGVRRFPITFYRQEWEKILGIADTIKQFIVDNDKQLAVKA